MGQNNYYSSRKRNGLTNSYKDKRDHISRNIYRDGYDTSREYDRGYYNDYHNNGDIYENEFVNANQYSEYDQNYDSPHPEPRKRNRGNFFSRIGNNIREAWHELRHHDDTDVNYDPEDIGYPREYGDDNRSFYNRSGEIYDRERRRQHTQYYADNDWNSLYDAADDWDSVYNAADENSYTGYARRRNNTSNDWRYDFDHRDSYNNDYNAVNGNDYDDYERGRREFENDKRRRELRRRRARFSM